MGEVMPLTPEDVSNKRFTPVRLREGYDMGEVDQFLDEVEAELERLNKENDDLRQKLAAAQRGGGEAPAAPAPQAVEKAPEPTPAPTPKPSEPAPKRLWIMSLFDRLFGRRKQPSANPALEQWKEVQLQKGAKIA